LRDKVIALQKKTKLLTDEQLQKKFAYYRQKVRRSPKKSCEKASNHYRNKMRIERFQPTFYGQTSRKVEGDPLPEADFDYFLNVNSGK
ncbi:8225_t:CDS:2, partial [Gigaspora rosea]